ncbi:MAG: DUF72 domain-containing protein [Chloroflexota bacterium]
MADPAGIYIGTSGWSYPKGEGTWNGHFYPAGRVDELGFYRQFFNTVEINSSFYYPVNPHNAERWVKKVPENFLFTVKLWQKFTHPKMFREATGEDAVISAEDVDIFNRGIAPLVRCGRLGAILAQFPPSFRNNDYGRQIIRAISHAFGKHHLAVELRHRSWSDDTRTAALLREHQIAWVQIDEPVFSSSVACDLPLTSDMAYFRFHGRNRENWWRGNAETRYKYLYTPEEIGELACRVAKAAQQCRMVFTLFNNHWQGYAPKNARDLQLSLGLRLAENVEE